MQLALASKREMSLPDSESDIEGMRRGTTLFLPEREGHKRCPDNITALLKLVLGACNGKVKKIESWVASICIGLVVLSCALIMGYHIHQLLTTFFWERHVPAIYISRAGNDFTFSVTLCLICLLWHSLCFQNKIIKSMWAMEGSLVSNVMTGGFFPRPAAASMGILLFVNAAMLKTVTTTGVAFESCIANAVELDEVSKWVPAAFWFQRFRRNYPYGCYGVGSNPTFPELTETYRTGFLVSSLPQANGALNATWATDNLLHPVLDGVPDYERYCSYTCSDFKSVSVSQLVMSVGVVFAGAAVVTKFTDMITSRVGWTLLEKRSSAADLVNTALGVNLPEQDELEAAAEDHDHREELVEALQAVHERMPGSACLCALQLFAVFFVATQLTPHISLDGYFTVDYYTTLLMVTSVLLSSMLRFYSPYNCRSIIYSKKLWTEGKDSFPVLNKDTQKFEDVELDLYDWIHLPARDRNIHLLHKCRAIGQTETAAGYTKKGLKPVDSEKSESGQNMDTTPLMDIVLEGLSKVRTCFGYIFCPWRFFCPASDVAEKEREKTHIITVTEIDVEWEVKEWRTTANGAPIVDKLFHEGRVQREVTGTIEKLSGKDGEVIVSFCGDEPVCFYTKEDGSAAGPVPKNSADGQSWQFSVPLIALRESTAEWSFTRKLFGDESLKDAFGA